MRQIKFYDPKKGRLDKVYDYESEEPILIPFNKELFHSSFWPILTISLICLIGICNKKLNTSFIPDRFAQYSEKGIPDSYIFKRPRGLAGFEKLIAYNQGYYEVTRTSPWTGDLFLQEKYFGCTKNHVPIIKVISSENHPVASEYVDKNLEIWNEGRENPKPFEDAKKRLNSLIQAAEERAILEHKK